MEANTQCSQKGQGCIQWRHAPEVTSHIWTNTCPKAHDDATPELDSTEDVDSDGNEIEGEEDEEVSENEYFELDDI